MGSFCSSWVFFNGMNEQDLKAIYAYFKTVKLIRNSIERLQIGFELFGLKNKNHLLTLQMVFFYRVVCTFFEVNKKAQSSILIRIYIKKSFLFDVYFKTVASSIRTSYL
jgi:hypothetical protein